VAWPSSAEVAERRAAARGEAPTQLEDDEPASNPDIASAFELEEAQAQARR